MHADEFLHRTTKAISDKAVLVGGWFGAGGEEVWKKSRFRKLNH